MLAAAMPLLVASCGDPAPEGTPTFARDIAPIIHASCTPCHRPGQAAPFPLLGYDDVHRRRHKILEVTRERRMPPWLPTHGDFVGDRRLPDTSIALFQAWVEAGALRGDPGVEPPPPLFVEGWQLGQPDLVLTVRQPIQVPAAGAEVFRNYVIPAGVDAVRFVAAVEVRPGNAAAHHAVLAVDATGRARQLDAADPEPGFPGMAMGGARPPDGNFLGWTPGKVARRCPDGMAWRLSPGDDLVLQLHLTPTGKPETLQPAIALYFTTVPPRVVTYPLCMFAPQIDLPAGASDVVVGDHFVVPVPVTVHSVYPHAHYLCRRMAAWATLPGGKRHDLFAIDRWDFDWQDDYTFREPIPLPAGTRIEFAYHYDNSAANPSNPSQPPRHVQLGDRSTDEMANLTLQLTTVDLEARRVLGEAGIRRDLDKRGYDAALLIELASMLRETGRHEEALRAIRTVCDREPRNAAARCELGNCLAAAGRQDEAERAYMDCLKLDPNQNTARVQLGNILLRSGRALPAIALYDTALLSNPDMPALHNNLATACMAAGQLDRAEHHFRRTVALDQSFFQAWLNLGRVLASTGRSEEARDALLRAKELRPDDPRAQQALQQLGN